MVLRTFISTDPLDLTPILFFAMLNRVSFVQRKLYGPPFSHEEVMGRSTANMLEEDYL